MIVELWAFRVIMILHTTLSFVTLLIALSQNANLCAHFIMVVTIIGNSINHGIRICKSILLTSARVIVNVGNWKFAGGDFVICYGNHNCLYDQINNHNQLHKLPA